MFAATVVTAETTASTTMMTATAAAITVVKTALFAALTVRLGAALALAFRAGTKLRTTIFTAVVATITATTASATIVLATAVSTAIAAFVAATFAGTFVLTRSGCGGSLLGGVAAEEALQPAEEAGFFLFGNGRRGLRLECARLFAAFAGLLPALAKWFTALARRLATRFARAKLVARFLRLIVTSRTVIGAGRAILTPGGAKARAGIATRISAGIRLFGRTADFPALSRANLLLGRENFKFGFGFDNRFGSGGEGFDRGRGRNRCDVGDGDWCLGSGLLCGDGRGGLLGNGWRFNDSGRSGLGRERIFILCLMVNDLDGGRLIGAGGGVCGGGWSVRDGALAARQA
jgi:hypothetical protein